MTDPRTGRVPKDQYSEYLRKADDAIRGMRLCSREGLTTSAGVAAIQAAISSADAVTTFHLGQRSTSGHHQDVLQLLGGLKLDGMGRFRIQLNEILKVKNLLQYEPATLDAPTLTRISLLAERVYEWAVQNTGP